MKVLVTGGSGFIGSHLVEYFQGKADVVVLDNLRTGRRENVAGLKCDFIEGCVTDRDIVRRAMEGVDYVFHLAAMISVPESMQNPLECVRINTTGTLVVLEEAAKAGVRKLCFSSSAAVYGNDPELPKREGMRPAPHSPYAVTKLDGEYYCAMFAAEGRLRTCALRYFNVFGPRQDPGGPYAAAVPIFAARAARNQEITIYGDGGQTRDFVFVKDVVAANVHLATSEDASGVFNVARGQSITIHDLAKTLIELTASTSRITFAPERAGDVRHSIAAVDRLQETGFRAETDLGEGLKATVGAHTAS